MKEYNLDEKALIVLDSYDGLEYKHKSAILSLYKSAGDMFKNSTPAYSYIAKNLGESLANTLLNSACDEQSGYVEFVMNKLIKRGIEAITFLSTDYPQRLKNLPLSPLVLYAKGNTSLLNEKHTFGIVGSRKTLPFVLKTGETIANDLSRSGVVIVSGSAIGGDRSALLGSIGSGKVISVLAHGHDYLYPQSNRSLVDKIAQSGLVISEYPPETTSAPWRFPMRNRLISALSDGILILSGAEDSGTRHTAKFAEAYSKRIYAIPYSIGEKSGEICNLLIKLNKAQLVENSFDVAQGENIQITEELIPDLTDEEIEILSVMDGQTHIDKISELTGKKSFEIISILSMLEINGIVSRGANNCYTALIKIKK